MTATSETMTPAEARTDTAQHWVVRLAAGDMSEAEAAQLKNWLESSDANQSAFERELSVWDQLEPFRDRFSTVADVVSIADAPRPRRYKPVVAGAIAASLLIAVLAANMTWVGLTADYTAGIGEQRAVSLSDGSVVTLNTGSAIKVRFSAAERDVELLRGEAYFEVEPDRQRPFRVLAQDGAAQAVGTAFSVHAKDRSVDVTVTEGVVAVAKGATGSADPVLVHKGERVSYGDDAHVLQPAKVDAQAAVAWRNGQLNIDAPSFAAAIAELERYWPGRVVVLRAPKTDRRISLVGSTGQIDNAITGLAISHGYQVSRIGDRLLILR